MRKREHARGNVAANPHSAHCPVSAVRAWLDRAGIEQGWVFRRISRDDAVGRRGLSAESARLILKARAREVGYTAAVCCLGTSARQISPPRPRRPDTLARSPNTQPKASQRKTAVAAPLRLPATLS